MVIQNNSDKSSRTLEDIETKHKSQPDIDNVIEEKDNIKDTDDLIEAEKDDNVVEEFSVEIESSDSDDDSIES